MQNRKKLLILSAAVTAIVGGLAARNVFSLNSPTAAEAGNQLQKETALLLTETGGTLSDKEAHKVIRAAQCLIVKSHTVGGNDWLEKLAQEYGAPALYIRSTNNLEDSSLRPSQQVIVYNKKGMVHTAKSVEPVDQVVKFYEKFGAKKEKIFASNNWDEIAEIQDGVLCLKPGSRLWIPEARKSFPIFFRPVAWSRISSRFGFRRHPILKTKRFHDGFDMVAPFGSPVYASESGVVTFAGVSGGYGNMVEIRHKSITTRYGHLSKISVEVGQSVKKKNLIGRVGSTGLSTGPHLHFEVRRNSDGQLQNPRKYLF